MNIYTSYFANIKNLEKNNIIPFSICAMPPKWFNGINIGSLAPTKEMVIAYNKGKINKEQYIKIYIEDILIAYKYNINVLLDRLNELSKGNDIALCCYEKPGDFCHRHILRKWLKDVHNIIIEEYPNTKLIKDNDTSNNQSFELF